jgi:hypothetical protein
MRAARRVLVAVIAAFASLALDVREARAFEGKTYAYEAPAPVRHVRAADVNGDGRADLIVLLDGGAGPDEVLILESPRAPVPKTYFAKDAGTRVRCDGTLADAGTLSVGPFGAAGAVLLRFLGPRGVIDVDPRTRERGEPFGPASLLARSEGRSVALWEGHADLDADGRDEIWYPLAEGDGAMHVLRGTGGGVTLDVLCGNRGVSTEEHLIARYAYVPNLTPLDRDGDGRRDLAALQGDDLVAWSLPALETDVPVTPSFRVGLRLQDERPLEPEEIRTPRLQIADVDGDRVSDLLITVVSGRRDQVGALRTTLYHLPGPFRDEKSGGLVAPRARIDTESVALHPRFLDVDGDGALDYVSDSIRGTQFDLLRRVMGEEPEITLVGFRFDRRAKTFESTPYFTIERRYSSAQAVNNLFGLSAWFADFDGDGHMDLLDAGNLSGVEILGAQRRAGGAHGDPVAFERPLRSRVGARGTLSANARIADVDGDARPDAVLWNEQALYLVTSGPAR